MAYNPYAAPQAQNPYAPPPGGAPPGQPQPWEPGEVYSRAWEIVKVHWVVLVFGTMIGGAIANAPQQIFGRISNPLMRFDRFDFTDGFTVGMMGGGFLLSYVIQAFFQAGFSKMFLKAARGATPEFGDIFSGGQRFLSMLGAMLLFGLIVGVGMVFLIVPGVILTCGLMFYPYYVVDQNMGAVDALKASWAATMGQKGKVFVLLLYAFGVTLLGLLACCIGILPAVAVVSVANAIVYIRISGAESGMNPWAAPPAPPGFGGPPGGYGGPPPGYGGPPPGYGGPPPGYGGPPPGYGGPPPGYGGGYPGGGYGPPR